MLPDRIEIETIKDVLPNFITARKEIARLKAEENAAAAADGREAAEVVYCQYCGRRLKNMQSNRAHLSGCPKKRAVATAAAEGIVYHAGDRDIRIFTRSIKLHRALEELEGKARAWIESGQFDPPEVERYFTAFIAGAKHFAPEGHVRFINVER